MTKKLCAIAATAAACLLAPAASAGQFITVAVPVADEPAKDSSPSFVAAIPGPATWGMTLLGFGLVGATMRYRRRSSLVIVA